MSALKLQTLKQKLWAIVAASFVARVIMFFALPSTASSLAPDERTYAALTKWIAESKPAEEFPLFGGDLYLSSRSIILPASFLNRFGVAELDAVRITSSIYGLIALCTVVFISLMLLPSNNSNSTTNKRIERLVVTLVLVYAFLPSHFAWSNLGLRESTNEFWLIICFIAVFLLFKSGQSKKLLIAMFISISILCTFTSRPQVGWVLVVSLLIYSILKPKTRLTLLFISSVLIGLFAGHFSITSPVNVTSNLYVAKDATSSQTKNNILVPTNRGEVEATKLCDETRVRVEYEGRIYNCFISGTITKREYSSNLAATAIDQIENLPGKQIVNQVRAASVIDRLTCPWDEFSEIGKYACLAFRAPYMTLTFLFRPLPFIDTTSLSSVFAAAENTLWILMFMLVTYRIFKVKRIPFLGELAPSIIFFVLYVVGAGSYEGNMGTAFRHKSLILWVVLLVLFAVFWRGQDEAKEPQGNNSQESAV
jgi:hypothetical protein